MEPFLPTVSEKKKMKEKKKERDEEDGRNYLRILSNPKVSSHEPSTESQNIVQQCATTKATILSKDLVQEAKAPSGEKNKMVYPAYHAKVGCFLTRDRSTESGKPGIRIDEKRHQERLD